MDNEEEELEKKPEKLVAVGILEDSTFTGKTRVKSKSNKFSSCDELDYPTPKKTWRNAAPGPQKALKKRSGEISQKTLFYLFSQKNSFGGCLKCDVCILSAGNEFLEAIEKTSMKESLRNKGGHSNRKFIHDKT